MAALERSLAQTSLNLGKAKSVYRKKTIVKFHASMLDKFIVVIFYVNLFFESSVLFIFL